MNNNNWWWLVFFAFMFFVTMNSDGAYYDDEYPDSLKLYERDSDYINKYRSLVDVDYYFVGKIIDTIKITISDDYEPVTYKWIYVQIDEDKIAKCIVADSIYTKYAVGDTIGDEFTKKKVEIQKKIKAEMTQVQNNNTKSKDIGDAVFIAFMFILCGVLILLLLAMIFGQGDL